jgi:hypothetical protein
MTDALVDYTRAHARRAAIVLEAAVARSERAAVPGMHLIEMEIAARNAVSAINLMLEKEDGNER